MKTFLGVTALVLVAATFWGAQSAHAQFQTFQTTLAIDITPNYPAPGTSFGATLQNLGSDFAQAHITWTVDGKELTQFANDSAITLVAPKTGIHMTIQAVVSKPGKTSESASITIVPQGLDLVWEGQTYIPPFYPGRALPAPDSTLRLVALPTFIEGGQEINPGELSYKWTVNDKVQLQQSGVGRNTLDAVMPHFAQPLAVNVLVTSNSGLQSQLSYLIPAESQAVRIYEDTPLLGTLFNHAINTVFALHGSEATLRAYPFYFSLPLSDTSFSWSLNGITAASAGNGPALTLRAESGVGTANVSLHATQVKQILQSATAAFTVSFGTSQ